MTTLFISDLHLDPSQKAITQNFSYFLQEIAPHAEALYILGDLFEAWIGDDHQSRYNRQIIAALRSLSDKTPVYIMHGNRDFLLGDCFCRESGCTLIAEPSVIDLYGTPTLLMHGDTLCTDDTAYIATRKKLRDPDFQRDVLRKPLWLRKIIAWYYRYKSRKYTQNAPAAIMDANDDEIKRVMQEHGVTQLIHGHTHRPSIDLHWGNEKTLRKKLVLSDWGVQGNYLECHESGEKYLKYFEEDIAAE